MQRAGPRQARDDVPERRGPACGEDGVGHGVARGARHQATKPLGRELLDPGHGLGLREIELLALQAGVGGRDGVRKRNRGVPPVEKGPQRRDACAPQREGIGRAGGRQTHGETPGERVEAIGEGDDRRDVFLRDVVVGADRLVVVADRIGDLARLAARQRVRAPHLPLKLGKLADHQRHEVALAEVRGAGNPCLGRFVEAEELGEPCREPLDALDLFADRPEPMMKDDAAELLEARLERGLLVFLPEEASVGQARAHHAVGALRDDVGTVGRVDDREVARQELVVALLHAEVLLVAPSDRPDHRRGQRQKRAVERSRHDVRLLDEGRVLVDEDRRRVLRSAGRARGRLHALHHRAYPLVAIDEHVPAAELLDVGAGAPQIERLRREKPVAARGPPALGAREGQRDDLFAEEGDDPLHRASERRVQVGPAHRFAKRNRAAYGAERGTEELQGRAPRLDPPPDHVAARLGLGSGGLLDDAERPDRDSQLGRERLRSLRRLSVLERCRLRGADDLLVEVELARRHLVDDDRKAARRAQRAHVPVRESHLRQLVGGNLREARRAPRRRRTKGAPRCQSRGEGRRTWPSRGEDVAASSPATQTSWVVEERGPAPD